MLPFLELDAAIVKDMITVNITAATYLCHQVMIMITTMPRMISMTTMTLMASKMTMPTIHI